MRTDTGPFSLIPEWLLESDVSDRAIRLYLTLGLYADKNGASFPSRKTLADRMGCSSDTIDRAKRELLDADAISVEKRQRNNGSYTSNVYVLARVRPPSRTDAATPMGTGAATVTRPSIELDHTCTEVQVCNEKDSAQKDALEEGTADPAGELNTAVLSSSASGAADQAAPGDPLTPSREGPPVLLDELWDACEEHVQKAPTAKSHRKAYAKLVRELLEAGWTPEQVAQRARAYRRNQLTREWPLTLAALAKWGEHVAPRPKPQLSVVTESGAVSSSLSPDENARRMRELFEGMA